MSQWKKVRIGDFLKRKRVPIVLDERTKYKLVTVRLYHKGIVLREEKLGSLIKSNMCKVSKGDFILSGIDARNGAFGIIPNELDGAIVTNDFWYFDIDESIIKREYFLWLTSTPVFLDVCQKASKGETQRIRLQKEAFFDYEINCPTIEYQDDFLSKIIPVINKIEEAKKQTEQQLEYTKLLRQNILQDAIEGKLTADWRKSHPVIKGNPDYDAEALFEKIQKGEVSHSLQPDKPSSATPSAGSNAARNAHSKKISSITAEEKPFDIPEGWKWVRLGEVSNIIGGYAFNSYELKETGDNFVLRLGNIRDNQIRYEAKPAFISNSLIDNLDDYKTRENDILLTMTGTRGKKDYLYSVKIKKEHQEKYSMFVNQRVCIIRTLGYVDFIYNCLHSEPIKEPIFDSATGSANQANIGIKALNDWVLPFPSLKEQKEIVNKIESLLAKVTELENQIQERKTLSEKLAFGIIKEKVEE